MATSDAGSVPGGEYRENPGEPSEQALVEQAIERTDTALIWINDSIADTAEAVERTRRQVEHAQRQLDRRRGPRDS